MYWSMLSSFRGIEGQYLLTSQEAWRKVLLPNTEE
jgi:hypothetical protein